MFAVTPEQSKSRFVTLFQCTPQFFRLDRKLIVLVSRKRAVTPELKIIALLHAHAMLDNIFVLNNQCISNLWRKCIFKLSTINTLLPFLLIFLLNVYHDAFLVTFMHYLFCHCFIQHSFG